jgi:hypothetical protein
MRLVAQFSELLRELPEVKALYLFLDFVFYLDDETIRSLYVACRLKGANVSTIFHEEIDFRQNDWREEGYYAPARFPGIGRRYPAEIQIIILALTNLLSSAAMIEIFNRMSQLQCDLLPSITSDHGQYKHEDWLAVQKNLLQPLYNVMIFSVNKALSVSERLAESNFEYQETITLNHRHVVQNAFCLMLLFKLSLEKSFKGYKGWLHILFPIPEYVDKDSVEYDKMMSNPRTSSRVCLTIMKKYSNVSMRP